MNSEALLRGSLYSVVIVDSVTYLLYKTQSHLARLGIDRLNNTLLFIRLDGTPIHGRDLILTKEHKIEHVLRYVYHDTDEARSWAEHVAKKSLAKQVQARRDALTEAVLQKLT